MKKILIIEDNPDIVLLIETTLKDYRVSSASSGEKGLKLFQSERPDLLLLDLNLPDMNGTEVCRSIRKIDENTPIFIISTRSEELDRVLGLELGADDYITKPFSSRELKARVDSFFRRWARNKKTPSPRVFGASGEEIVRGALRIEPRERLVHMNDQPVRVFGKEYEILKLLSESPGQVFSREMIIKAVWKKDRLTSERNVDNHIKRLRSKFKKFTGHSEWIETVRKDGYRFTNYYDSIPVIHQK